MEKNNKKIINAWCMYDWANSVFSLTITTAVFPEYFLAVTSSTNNGNKVEFLGMLFNNAALYSYALSFSFLIAAFLSPLLTPIADYTGRKKLFMKFFCYLGSFSCAYLFFFTSGNITSSIFAFMLAAIGWSGSIVFYNSYLPEIATEDRVDKISARGYSYGYVGSVLLLIVNLAMILKPELFGFTAGTAMPARVSFLTVGIWWFGFSQYSFYYLPSNTYGKVPAGNWIFNGFRELRKVFLELRKQRFLKIYLPGFFFYSMGVQTVMYMATIFGKGEIKLGTPELITAMLLIQIIAIAGAYFCAKLSSLLGNIKAIQAILIVWIGICIAAYFVYDSFQFYILATIVGFVMGGIQSLSRSTYSKLIPEDSLDHASYFSFYDVMEKLSIFLGTLSFGLITELSGGMRNSLFGLTFFFIVGFFILLAIPSKKEYHIHSN